MKKIVYSVRGGLARSGSSRLCGYIQVTEKPTKSEDTAVGGKWISVAKQRSKATETEGTQARKRRHITIKQTKKSGTESYKCP